jgi:hypothetical protein
MKYAAMPADTMDTGSGRRLWRTIKRTLLLLVLAAILLFALYTWSAYHYAYAEGERAGYIQKFSKKGWICKTWEGELAMANLPGAMPEVFHFTVRNEEVAKRITASMGERVSIHYHQHRGLPTTCFGDTTYFVDETRRVETPPSATAPMSGVPSPAAAPAPTPTN